MMTKASAMMTNSLVMLTKSFAIGYGKMRMAKSSKKECQKFVLEKIYIFWLIFPLLHSRTEKLDFIISKFGNKKWLQLRDLFWYHYGPSRQLKRRNKGKLPRFRLFKANDINATCTCKPYPFTKTAVSESLK